MQIQESSVMKDPKKKAHGLFFYKSRQICQKPTYIIHTPLYSPTSGSATFQVSRIFSSQVLTGTWNVVYQRDECRVPHLQWGPCMALTSARRGLSGILMSDQCLTLIWCSGIFGCLRCIPSEEVSLHESKIRNRKLLIFLKPVFTLRNNEDKLFIFGLFLFFLTDIWSLS